VCLASSSVSLGATASNPAWRRPGRAPPEGQGPSSPQVTVLAEFLLSDQAADGEQGRCGLCPPAAHGKMLHETLRFSGASCVLRFYTHCLM
jgi:hypothetical protein